MFHNRASETPGLTDGGNHHQNENSVIRGHINSMVKNLNGPGGPTNGGGGGSNNSTSTKGVSFQTPSHVKKSAVGGTAGTNTTNGGGRRRALGDISNKKISNNNNNNNGVHQHQSSSIVSSHRKSLGQSAIKPKFVVSSNNVGESLIPTFSTTPSTKPSGSTTRAPPTLIPSPSLSVTKSTSMMEIGQQFQQLRLQQQTTNQQAPLQFRPKTLSSIESPVPSTYLRSTSSKKEQSSSSSKLVHHARSSAKGPKIDRIAEMSKVVELPAEPMPDIEYPAGRTWKQQLAFDLKDDDDAASTSTLDHLLRDGSDDDEEEMEKDRTMWDDWSESLRQRRQNEQHDRFDHGEDEIQAQFEKLLEQDKLGLESLYDSTEQFNTTITLSDHNSIGSTDFIFKDGMKCHLLELDDDDWSIPASSECGQLDRSGDVSFLFHL